MNIKIIHPLFTIYGGAEKVVLDWFNQLKKEHEVELHTLYYNNCLKNLENVFWATKELPKLNNVFGFKINPFNRKAIKITAKHLAENIKKEDIIFYTVFPAPLIINEAIKINPSIKNNKIIFHSFEPDRILYYREQKKLNLLPPDVHNWKFNLITRVLGRWRRIDKKVVNKYVDYSTTMSDFVTALTKKFYSKLKVSTVMEMYVHLDNFKLFSKEQARKNLNEHYKFGLKNSDFIILSMGRLEKSKGVEELLEIVKQIKEEGKIQPKLLIGGKGELYDFLIEKTKNLNYVHMLGFVPDKLLSSLYCAGNIFVFLGINETGGPLTVIEAMYAKNLIVASNKGGPPELMEDEKHGFLVDTTNNKEIKEAIKKCYDVWKTKEYNKMTSEGQKKVTKFFSFKRNYKDLINALKL